MTLYLPAKAIPAAHAAAYARGAAAFEAGDWNAAITAYTEALNYHEDANTWTNLGAIYQQNWKLGQAIRCYRRALTLDPDQAQALGNLANVYGDTLEPERGLRLKREAVALLQRSGDRAATLAAHAELVFTATTLRTLPAFAAEMRDFCRQRLSRPIRPWVLPPAPRDRKIRLGYLSADFNRHTVMVLLEPLFQHYDRERFELFLYSNTDKPDDLTARLKTEHRFYDISRRTDRAAELLMRQHKLDLLVDLSGYSSGHRLPLLARKPAPRIATGLGFITPIAHPAIDYVLLDDAMIPDHQAHLIPERLARIPSNMFYRPEPELPLQVPDRAAVVFGSANSLFKLNDTVIECWAHILRLIPSSLLSLRAKALSDPEILEKLKARFADHGIDPTRILGAGAGSRREFMEWYHGVDIALDPFPYQGGVTSSEALYMGCPLIACDAGGINTSVSILRAADLGEYVAATPEDYVRLAVHLGLAVGALDGSKRLAIRQHIRQQISRSPIFDAGAFVGSLERAYEQILAGKDSPP